MKHNRPYQNEFEALVKPAATCVVLCCALFASTSIAFATIDNTAVVRGNYGAAPVVSEEVTVRVPVNSAASLVVTKEADDTTDVVAGQTVTYTYVIRNNGAVTLSNISLADSHNASGPVPVPGGETLSDDQGTVNDSSDAAPNDGIWTTLAPGDAVTLTATYVVTQSDVETLQ
jgi:large repetitive protein